MKKEMIGKSCLIKKRNKNKKAKIVRGFVQVGGPDHGEEFVCLILEDHDLNMWDRETVCKLSNVKLLD